MIKLGVWGELARLGFVIVLENDEDYEEAKPLIYEGFTAWLSPDYMESHIEQFPHFTSEDCGWIYGSGYAEPTMELLDKANIKYKLETPWDDDGELLDENYDEDEIEWVYA